MFLVRFIPNPFDHAHISVIMCTFFQMNIEELHLDISKYVIKKYLINFSINCYRSPYWLKKIPTFHLILSNDFFTYTKDNPYTMNYLNLISGKLYGHYHKTLV